MVDDKRNITDTDALPKRTLFREERHKVTNSGKVGETRIRVASGPFKGHYVAATIATPHQLKVFEPHAVPHRRNFAWVDAFDLKDANAVPSPTARHRHQQGKEKLKIIKKIKEAEASPAGSRISVATALQPRSHRDLSLVYVYLYLVAGSTTALH